MNKMKKMKNTRPIFGQKEDLDDVNRGPEAPPAIFYSLLGKTLSNRNQSQKHFSIQHQ